MSLKSERLKKLENELGDLEQWLKLGLVPKKDIEKHKEEMRSLEKKIKEERERLKLLKESGETEEFAVPKRPTRAAFQEPQSLPDMDIAEDNLTDAGLDMETESYDFESTSGEETESGEEETTTSQVHEEDEEDPFSDKNRWRRGVLEDPDSNEW